MYECKFVGLTKEQAITLAKWYEGQGEQNADIWFEENGIRSPIADCGRDGGPFEIKDGNVTVYCK